MNWDSNIYYFLLLLLATVVISIYGQEPGNVEKSNLTNSDNTFQINECDPLKSITEIILLDEASKFNPTYKELVIIIGNNGTDAVDLAKLMTNGNQTIHNVQLHEKYLHDPRIHAQQHLFEYYDKESKTAYFAHRGEFVEGDFLVNRFLTKKVIDYAEKVKIILTCKSKDGLENIFKLAHRVVPNILKYKQHMLLITTKEGKSNVSDKKEASDLLKEMSSLSNSTGEIAQFLLNHKLFAGITSFSKESRNLIESLVDKLSYAKSNKTDFAYPHPTGLMQEFLATCVYTTIPQFFSESAHFILQDIEEYLDNFMKEKCVTTNFTKLHHCAETLEQFNTHILSIYKELKNLKSPNEFFYKMRNMVQHLNFSLSKNTSTFVFKEREPVCNYLFKNSKFVHQGSEAWVDPFSSFLKKYSKLFPFYRSFLKKSDMNFFYLPIDERITLQAKAFRAMQLTVFNKGISTKCDPMDEKKYKYKMEVRGEIVSLSYVKNKICENVTYLEIFALNTVVIDESLNLRNKKVQVGIVAPTWIIIGRSREIDLSGSDGKNWETTAENGNVNGTKIGATGKPGLPGESAGHFYGIAENILNEQHLTVLADGGNGGAGQAGGFGANGEDGETYNFKRDGLFSNKNNEKYTKLKKNDFPKIHVEIFGIPGTSGHRGGNGGMGGQGGRSGDIKILLLESNSDKVVKTSNKTGETGKMGNGGKGGSGGINGNDIQGTSQCAQYTGLSSTCSEEFIVNDTKIKGSAASGADGKNGNNFIGRKMSREVKKVQTFARVVNNYKNYAIENFDHPLRNIKLKSFYTLLSNDEEIVHSYSVLDLIEEFIDLEKQLATHANISMLFSSYDNLLERVKKLNNEMKNKNIKDEYKTIPISSMLIDLKVRIHHLKTYILNEAHFSIESEFEKLKYKHKPNLLKATAAEEFTSVFKTILKDIDDNIEEGHEVLETIRNIIEAVENDLDTELESIIVKVTQARRDQKKAIEDLGLESQGIQAGIIKKMFIGVGKTILQSLAIINPALGAVGVAGTSLLTIVEKNINNKGNYSKSIALVSTTNDVLNAGFKAGDTLLTLKKKAVEELIKKKESMIEAELKTLPANDDNAKVLQDWKNMSYLKSNEDNSQPLSLSFKTAESKLDEEKNKLLENAEKGKVKKYDKALKIVEKFKTATQVAEVFGEVGKSIEDDQALLDGLGKSIKKARENIANLTQFEKKIYDNIFPILDGIKEQFGLKSNDLSKISKIRLSLVQWEIRQNLETTKETMKSMLQNFDDKGAFTWTMQKLINAVDILLYVEKQISELHKKKSELKWLPELNIKENEEIPQSWFVGDIHLSRSFTILNKLYQQNVFNKVYSEWFRAYKHFVFPYFETLEFLPPLSDDASFLVQLKSGLTQVEILLKDYHYKRFPPRQSTMNFVNSSTGTSEPFYIWRNEEYKMEIDELLSGKPVNLFADFTNLTENAVKFDNIWIKFYDENNRTVENDFKYFLVKLVHEGDSYYKCDNKTYIIRNTPTTLEYGTDEVASYKGGQHQSVIEKDFILSPYGKWTIQLLQPRIKPKEFSFLDKYKGKLHLALEGHGSFIKEEEKDLCQDSHLSRFYDTVNEMPLKLSNK